jgi:hypothetical protein
MAIKIENEPKKIRFRKKCEYCLCEFSYEQEDIGYRPWYPKGFVYCPKCGKPLRHHPEQDQIKE